MSVDLKVTYKPEYRKYVDQAPSIYVFKNQAEAEQFIADYADYAEIEKVSA